MNIKNFLKINWKKPVFFVPAIIILIALIIMIFGLDSDNGHSFIIAEKGSIISEISVTGRVRASQNVELGFERGGKVENVFVEVGGKVFSGQKIVSLSNKDVSAQVLQANASYEAELAKLEEMNRGTREEEIAKVQTAVDNAKRVVEDSENNLEIILEKSEIDLTSDYTALISASIKSSIAAKSALITLSDIQLLYFLNSNPESQELANEKSNAIFSLFGVAGASMPSNLISGLNSGTFEKINNLSIDDEGEFIYQVSEELFFALQKTARALDAVPITSSLTATEKANLASEKSLISGEINTLSSKMQDVLVQKSNNISAISIAKAELNSAKNSLAVAEDDLTLKLAGYTDEQILAQSAVVKSAMANWMKAQADLEKTILRASFSGIVTKVDVKEGEIVSINTPVVWLISDKKFEMEANIAEIDISSISVGKKADISLDAYGSDVIFSAEISAIDPAATMIEGVAVYKTTIVFDELDERILSGMTANIDILSDKKENVLIVPQRAVFSKNGDKFVNILGEDGLVVEKKVITGLRGSDGNIEIIDGVLEGDKVITSLVQ